jgi:hypothetical protein
MYYNISLIPFVLAIGIATAPLNLMNLTGNERWIWRYTLLICVSLILYYWPALDKFLKYYETIRTNKT